jgi:hypothetical protein
MEICERIGRGLQNVKRTIIWGFRRKIREQIGWVGRMVPADDATEERTNCSFRTGLSADGWKTLGRTGSIRPFASGVEVIDSGVWASTRVVAEHAILRDYSRPVATHALST